MSKLEEIMKLAIEFAQASRVRWGCDNAKAAHDALESALRAALKDAERYQWLRAQTQGVRGIDSYNYPWFKLPAVPVPNGMDIMRGSIAQHLDSAIDLSGKPG